MSMSNSFKPLRRKLGVVRLVIACVMLAGWIRSLRNYDAVHFLYNRTRSSFGTVDGRLSFAQLRSIEEPNPIEDGPRWNYTADSEFRSYDAQGNWIPIESLISTEGIEWRSDWAGFHVSLGVVRPKGNEVRFGRYLVPYWSIVLPLALLSASLLLSKPRTAKSQSLRSPEL